MRGRLIFPFSVELALLDTAATAAVSDYDDDFREPTVVNPGGSTVAAAARAETTVTLPAQLEPARREELRMGESGRDPQNQMSLVFHFRDLEAAGLVDASGVPLLRSPGTRLVAIRNPTTGALIEQLSDNWYSVESRTIGFGLGPNRNLLLVRFEQRSLSS